jgi:hypothetical protein
MKLLAATLVTLAFPATAWGEATLVTRELPVGGARMLAASAAPTRFNLIGLHWRGSGRVFFRTHGSRGWSHWQEADAEAEDLPDRWSAEARRRSSWRIGNPFWTGTADRVQIRTKGRVQRVRGHFVWSPEESELERRLQIAGAPPIITRQSWGADEQIRRGNPSYAQTLNASIVHHTAGASPSSPAQSAAIVRGIYTYHVRGNGWNDIGYNFLVDRFGQIFEGRYGGIERNVVGAHAQGFNTGSVGIAVLGSYGGGAPSTQARDALARVIAWRLDVAHVDPVARIPWVSSGRSVMLRAVSGHRDTGQTTCPGAGLYGQLGALAQRAQSIGLPKLYTPEIEGSLGGLVSFSARLSSALPWTVTVIDAAGAQVAVGGGTGPIVQWTWDSRLAPRARYTYRIASGNARAIVGTIGSGPASTLTIAGLRADPSSFTPNGDGVTDTTKVSYRLGAAATVTVDLQGEDGVLLSQLFVGPQAAGPQVFTWDGGGYPDGRYRLVVTARAARGRQVAASAPIVLSRTLSGFTVAPTVLSPNADGRKDNASISFALAVPAFASIQVLKGGRQVVRPLYRELQPGPQTLTWKGGVRDGDYSVALTVTDTTGSVTQAVPVRIDRVKPRLRLASRRPVRLSLSEPARVTLVADGRTTSFRRPKAGIFLVALGRPFKRLVGYAEDAAGNISPRVRLR